MQFDAGTQIGKTKNRSVSCKKEWIIKPPSRESEQLARSLKISPLLAQVLINRGIKDSSGGHTFLRPKLTELIKDDLVITDLGEFGDIDFDSASILLEESMKNPSCESILPDEVLSTIMDNLGRFVDFIRRILW